jgi:hypothetical protein
MISLSLYTSYREASEREMKAVLTTNKVLKTCRRKQNSPYHLLLQYVFWFPLRFSMKLASLKGVCQRHHSKHHLAYCIAFSNRYSTLRDSNCHFLHCTTPRTEKATNFGVWLVMPPSSGAAWRKKNRIWWTFYKELVKSAHTKSLETQKT